MHFNLKDEIMNAKLYERIELYFPEGADNVNITKPDGSSKNLETFKKTMRCFHMINGDMKI